MYEQPTQQILSNSECTISMSSYVYPSFRPQPPAYQILPRYIRIAGRTVGLCIESDDGTGYGDHQMMATKHKTTTGAI